MSFVASLISNILSFVRKILIYFKRKIKKYIYPKYRRFKIGNFAKISYSQCGEDLIIKFIFDCLGIEKPSYIDIGAHDPEYLNNTNIFYLNGSRGINIEPDPYCYQRIQDERNLDINLNIGMADIVSEMDFYFMSTSTLNTFSKSEADKYADLGHPIISVRKIKVDTLPNIIHKYCNGRFPDFLSLDVEGMDEIILKSINYDKNSPIVICVETISFSENGNGIKNRTIIEFLESKGYLVYADTYINTIFVKKDKWIRP